MSIPKMPLNWNEVQEEQFIDIDYGYHTFQVEQAEWKEGKVPYIALKLRNQDGGTLSHNLTYNEERPGFFKRDINRFEEWNPGFIFDFKAEKLIGKTISAIVTKEEYRKNNGEISESPRIQTFLTKTEFQDKKIAVKPLKKLSPLPKLPDPGINDDDLPF